MPDDAPNISLGEGTPQGADVPAPTHRLSPMEFGSLLSASRKTLWSIAAGVLSDRTSADDCVQDAAAIGLGKLNEFDATSNFGAWMGQIVRFVALNELRKRSRSKTSAADPEIMAASVAAAVSHEPAPIDHTGRFSTDQSAFDDRTQAALRSLDETARICLLLRTVHSMPYEEISRILGIPEGTAMSHVHRARASMRERLGGGHPSRAHAAHPTGQGGRS